MSLALDLKTKAWWVSEANPAAVQGGWGDKGKSLAWYRNFALTVTAGLAIFYGAIFGWSANATRSSL
jgi:hypothetical protein